MSNVNRGKEFEGVVREAFKRMPDTMVTRLQDPVQGYLGIRNICDFLIYHYPYQYCIECKSVHGERLSFQNITHNQWAGMYEAVQNKGVVAGIICWWIDKDVTKFIPIKELHRIAEIRQSIRYDATDVNWINIDGKKKRVFFDYDMTSFIAQVEHEQAIRLGLSGDV